MLRKCRCLYVVFGLAILTGLRAWANNDEIEARMKKDVEFLAAPECEGRGPGTKGIDRAADYIAAEFKKAGLKPAGKMNSYFQPFRVNSGPGELQAPGALRLRGPQGQEISFTPTTDFQTLAEGGTGKVEAPMVFVGYGASAPDIKYDDYKDIDVAGKVVVMLRYVPRRNNKDLPFDGDRKDSHAELIRKVTLAESKGAAAVILVNPPSEESDKLSGFNKVRDGAGIPAIHVQRPVIDAICQSSLGQSLKEIEQAIDRDLQPRGAPLKGWSAALETSIKRTGIPVKNVAGYLEGKGMLAKQIVVVGAHYDHLGKKGQNIFHGADDNASGTTAVIELARRFGRLKDREGRTLLFMTFSAEEMGLLGSKHYVKEPLMPLADTSSMLNLDMVGRLRPDAKTGKDRLLVQGLGTAKDFDAVVTKLNGNPGFEMSKMAGVIPFSDHYPFYDKKIPVLFYWTDTHKEYHKVTDTADLINVPGMRKITDLAEKTIAYLATVPDRPEFIPQKSTFKPVAGGAPKMGFAPGSYEKDKGGCLVGEVSAGSPAEKAGMKQGDLIVEVAGKPVSDVFTYLAIMRQQRAGQALEVIVLRGKERIKLKATPQ